MITSCNQKIDILGVPMSVFEGYDQTVAYIASEIQAGHKTFCVAVNPEKVYCSRKDTELRKVLHEADIGICDGIGTTWAAKILHGQYVPRCTGADLFMKLMAESVRKNWRVFLLGGSEEANRGTYDKLKEQFPNVQIAGRQNGFFEDVEKLIEQINASKADLLFVALGSPQQELWISKYRHQINARFFLGVGGTFDVVSGRVKRAPLWMQRLGLEFFYRFCQFPARFSRHHRRPLFGLFVLVEKMKQTIRGLMLIPKHKH